MLMRTVRTLFCLRILPTILFRTGCEMETIKEYPQCVTSLRDDIVDQPIL